MSDPMSSGGGGGGGGSSGPAALGLGLMKYISAIQANKNARAVNATSSKWAPLLALNKSEGKADIKVPTASFANVIGPAIVSATNSMGGGKKDPYPSGSVDDIQGMDGDSQAMAGGQGEPGGGMGSIMQMAPMLAMLASGGGKVPKTPKYGGGGLLGLGEGDAGDIGLGILAAPLALGIGGGLLGGLGGVAGGAMGGAGGLAGGMGGPAGGMGGMAAGGGMAGGGKLGGYDNGGMIQSLMKLAPLALMLAPGGGQVPGKEVVPGDSPKNDTTLVKASPGEIVLPKSVAQDGMKGNKWKVAAYLNEVKHHGPGPMPVKSQNSKPTTPSKSMSPWGAMCGGGMTR